MSRSLLWFVILQCGLSVAATAQVEPNTVHDPDCGNLTTASQCLAETFAVHHIPVTKDGLMFALHSDDIRLRNLAVNELAEEGVREAVPDLLALLDAEVDPNERVALAGALAKLGNGRGMSTLEAYCDDKTASLDARLNAAARLLRYQPRPCTGTIMEALQSTDFRYQAMFLIMQWKELSPGESAQVKAILVKCLSNADSGGRVQAAGYIAKLGDLSAIPALEAATAKETDPAVRNAMEYYLKTLKAKGQRDVSQAPQ